MCAVNRLIRDADHIISRKRGHIIDTTNDCSILTESKNIDQQPENIIADLKFSFDSKVEANYKGQNRWYPCSIIGISPDGLYDVEYSDGVRESSIQSEFIRPAIPIVEEKLNKKNNAYPIVDIIKDPIINTVVPTVSSDIGISNVTVETDNSPIYDHNVEYEPMSELQLSRKNEDNDTATTLVNESEHDAINFVEGDKVEANYRESGQWQLGIIRKVRPDGRFDIDYSNGLRELRIDKSFIRTPLPVETISDFEADKIGAGAQSEVKSVDVGTGLSSSNVLDTKSSTTESLIVGSEIECNFKSIGRWYPGRVSAIHADATFDIDYDDGDKEQRVARGMIRILSSMDNQAPRSRSTSPSGRTKSWNPFFNMPPSRTLPSGPFYVRKGCTCAIPGYDCYRKGGCLYESLQLAPLDVANRPRFTVRKFCECEGLCGCKVKKEHVEHKEEEPVVVDAPPPVVMVSFAVQTDEPVDTVDEGMQYDGPLMVENGMQYEGFTEQKSMQTENFTATKFMQTENPQSEYAIQSDGPVFVDQACQTINFEKRRKKEIFIPFDKRPPFVVKALCLDGCVCCCSRPVGGDKTAFQHKGTEVSLKNIWTKWAMEHHTFSNVVLTEKEINQFSGAVKEFLVAPSEVVSFSTSTTVFHPSVKNMMQNRWEGAEMVDIKNTLPSLKYFMTDKKSARNNKQSGLIVRALTNDQRLQNKLFLRECRNLWKVAEFILNTRIIQNVISGSKDRLELIGPVNDLVNQLQRNETKVLYEFSLKKLRVMLEDDEDKRQRDESERARERLKEGASSHQQFIRKKDRSDSYQRYLSSIFSLVIVICLILATTD